MSKLRMIKSVTKEYGLSWLVNRTMYSLKLKIMSAVPITENLYEKKTMYPNNLDIFQINVNVLKSFLRNRLAEEDKKLLIVAADRICEGIINGFSSVNLNYGNPVNWQLNPITGKQCDVRLKWYRIPDFENDRGDIKVIWEASRFSHFITLARAFLLTENKLYYETFSTQLKDWVGKNPYGFGANFKCSQECSLRMVNALLAYTIFKNCGIATDADASNIKDLVDRCYRKVLSNFFYAYKCIKNNHTISELMGMIVGAWCCDDQKQLNKAYKLLDEVIDEQFTSDGGYRQFSFNYQRLALQDLEIVMSIESKIERRLSNRSRKKLVAAVLLMYQCQDESGDMPNYGSNDGALVFPVSSCGYRDFRSVINTVHALTTGKQLYKDDKHQEELIWFSSGKRIDGFEFQNIKRISSQFVDAGLFTIRDHNAWMMIVANNYQSRPAHMDQMHIDLWISNLNVLCDAGTYSYANKEGRKLIKNESHNTVTVKDAYQMNYNGSFMIYDWTKRRLGRCDDSCFEGKCVSANGYTHRRRVEFRNGAFEITDKVDKPYEIIFHTPCKVEICNGLVILSWNGRKLCVIQSNGEIELRKSKRSLYYLRQQETTCVVIYSEASKEINTKIEITKGELKSD